MTGLSAGGASLWPPTFCPAPICACSLLHIDAPASTPSLPRSREYGAERMCLAVLGGEPLDTLEGWARDLFTPVKGGHCGPAPTFEGQGFPFEVRVTTGQGSRWGRGQLQYWSSVLPVITPSNDTAGSPMHSYLQGSMLHIAPAVKEHHEVGDLRSQLITDRS